MRYDATRASLLHPEEQATVFCPGQDWPIEAVCAECSRLAYVRFEADEREKATLTEAIARAGLSDPQFFSDPRTGTQAFAAIGAGGSAAFIVFRGTQPDDLSDIGTDAQAVLVDWQAQGKVHLGFRDALASVWDPIEILARSDRSSDLGHGAQPRSRARDAGSGPGAAVTPGQLRIPASGERRVRLAVRWSISQALRRLLRPGDASATDISRICARSGHDLHRPAREAEA
jgi:hypothetical protein